MYKIFSHNVYFYISLAFKCKMIKICAYFNKKIQFRIIFNCFKISIIRKHQEFKPSSQDKSSFLMPRSHLSAFKYKSYYHDTLLRLPFHNSVALSPQRTILTERPPLVGEIYCQILRIERCRVVRAADPLRSLISVF
jgi:hypothetical protein